MQKLEYKFTCRRHQPGTFLDKDIKYDADWVSYHLDAIQWDNKPHPIFVYNFVSIWAKQLRLKTGESGEIDF